MEYLYFKNWSKFQQYKDRNPPWVKLHFELLSSTDWVLLSDASRLLLVTCLLVASRHQGRVPYNTAYMRRLSHLNYVNFNPLIECGFLQKTQANDTKWLAETETYREETETDSRSTAKKGNYRGRKKPTTGAEALEQILENIGAMDPK